MVRMIAFSNRKGGSGKTTTSVNVSAALAHKGYRVLVVDTDPQGHTTISFGNNVNEIKKDLASVLMDDDDISDCIIGTYLKKLQVIPATKKLVEYERHFSALHDARLVLAEKMNSIISSYDFIVFDTPPTLSLLTLSSLIAANEVYIPMPTHFLAMEGLAEMVRLIYKINRLYNPKLKLMGIIPTFYKENTRLARNVISEIRKNLGHDIILHPVRVNIALAEAPGYGKTIFQYKLKSNGAYDYYKLAEEIERIKNGKQKKA